MNSPIRDSTRNFNCLNELKKKIPRGSVVHSYLFYGGELEIGLTTHSRFVCAHTSKYVIHEFWNCLLVNPRKVHEIVTSDVFSFDNENMFALLQENWARYKDPYVRAALFFLLNQLSESGRISHGKITSESLNPLSLSLLKNLALPHFHLEHDAQDNVVDNIRASPASDCLLVPAGHYGYNLLEHGKNKAIEEERINHAELHELLTTELIERRWVVLYHWHPELLKLYRGYKIALLDGFGRVTSERADAKEMIIANF
tara:strand:- start:1911 stop:2681 length:771 start_codon:yes stop_codon:yes gene_type:complete